MAKQSAAAQELDREIAAKAAGRPLTRQTTGERLGMIDSLYHGLEPLDADWRNCSRRLGDNHADTSRAWTRRAGYLEAMDIALAHIDELKGS